MHVVFKDWRMMHSRNWLPVSPCHELRRLQKN